MDADTSASGPLFAAKNKRGAGFLIEMLEKMRANHPTAHEKSSSSPRQTLSLRCARNFEQSPRTGLTPNPRQRFNFPALHGQAKRNAFVLAAL